MRLKDYAPFLPILQEKHINEIRHSRDDVYFYFRTALDGVDGALATGAKAIGATPAVFKLFVSLLVRVP